jgi:hypothetical protein
VGTSDVNRYEGKNGDNADADEEEDTLQANDESTQNVEDRRHSTFDLGINNIDGYEGEDGNDEDEADEASPANDGSTQNVED